MDTQLHRLKRSTNLSLSVECGLWCGAIKPTDTCECPPFASSLDVIWDAERTLLRPHETQKYWANLIMVLGKGDIYSLVHASARSRCIAFILTKMGHRWDEKLT